MTDSTTQLNQRRCLPCEGGVPALEPAAALALQAQLHARWQLDSQARELAADFEFRNYFRTIAYVNAVAYVAMQEDHHPQIDFGYKQARIRWWTHAVNGLTENDFICAAKVDALIDERNDD